MVAAGQLSPFNNSSLPLQSLPEVLVLVEPTIQAPAPRRRTGISSSNLHPQREAKGQKVESGNESQKNVIRHSSSFDWIRRRSTPEAGYHENVNCGASICAPSNAPSLPTYAESDSTAHSNQLQEPAQHEKLLHKEVERLESTISQKYPRAKLFYITVSEKSKLRLFNTADSQQTVKAPTKPGKAYESVSYIACEGLTDPSKHEWFIQKAVNGVNSQKPLKLRCHNMASHGKEGGLQNYTRKNYEDVSRSPSF